MHHMDKNVCYACASCAVLDQRPAQASPTAALKDEKLGEEKMVRKQLRVVEPQPLAKQLAWMINLMFLPYRD